MDFLKKLIDGNEREIKRFTKRVQKINELEESMKALSDEELKAKSEEFKSKIKEESDLDSILNEAFAAVREASKRIIGLRHFDVQLIGGMVLHQGRIVEMRTGEGKTLVATSPVYLNALLGKGVHVVTVNDYLAKRDCSWMGPIYHFMGLSVASIQHDAAFKYNPNYICKDASLNYLEPISRKEAYDCDITYGTNNEFGFDYLRDNMVMSIEDRVQRDRNYAIVDEVDSILIDEARTPLIISGRGAESTDLYVKFSRIARNFNKDVDYTVDEKAHSVPLTEAGVTRLEKELHLDNLYDNENMELTHHMNSALKAKELFKKDVEYVVKDNEIVIVDENTGRLMFGRRYSDGIHQAIEAKEGMKVKSEDQTLASITFQNYFRLYSKLGGMTGTALTEEREFREIYNLDVVVIPTNRAMIRKDMSDVVYKTEKAKFEAVITQIEELHKKGQPVLVGTRSIEKSELLGFMLKRKGIPHNILNAKYHEKEAQIIAQAGKKGAVTIATNMAGRGVDILLGGNPPDEGITQEDIRELGGLYILGTERHESRRIDNQLRGRSGRQGDSGCSRFYVALEDELMRLFGSDKIASMMDKLGIEDNEAIEHGFISKAIENAQKKVEMHHFDMRKTVLDYDNVMNMQREVIYAERDKMLGDSDLRENINSIIETVASSVAGLYASPDVSAEDWDWNSIARSFNDFFPSAKPVTSEELQDYVSVEDLSEFLGDRAIEIYNEKEKSVAPEIMRQVERYALLRILDEKWIDHLCSMDILREGIGLRAYGQKDPRIEYVNEAYIEFEALKQRIQEDTVKFLMRVRIQTGGENQNQEKKLPKRQLKVNRGEGSDGAATVVRKQVDKPGPNEPCSCGSGKKYKKCCGASK